VNQLQSKSLNGGFPATPVAQQSPSPNVAIVFTQQGNPKASLANTKAAIVDLAIAARRDEFRDQIVLGGNGLPGCYDGAASDRALTWIRNAILACYGFDPGDELVHSAIKGLAEENRFNPVKEWLVSLVWDGKARLRTWLPRITGAADTELHQHAGARLILGMIARAFYPGTKFDLCAVFEGQQGCGKSTLASLLAGEEYFTDAPGLLAMDTKARGELLVGRWVAELGELSGLNKTEVELVKATISQTHDHFRGAYERLATKRPRTCIFIGTTNSGNYLMDTTGSRRFLPIKCGPKIDLVGFKAERLQLFAEGVMILGKLLANSTVCIGQPLPVHINLGLPQHLWASAASAAEDRRIVDHGEEVLALLLSDLTTNPSCRRQQDGSYFVSSYDLESALRFKLPHAPHSRTVANWMAKLGWRRTKHSTGKGQVRGYQSPA